MHIFLKYIVLNLGWLGWSKYDRHMERQIHQHDVLICAVKDIHIVKESLLFFFLDLRRRWGGVWFMPIQTKVAKVKKISWKRIARSYLKGSLDPQPFNFESSIPETTCRKNVTTAMLSKLNGSIVLVLESTALDTSPWGVWGACPLVRA